MYHNTTESLGKELLEFGRKARTQDEKILYAMEILCGIRPEGWSASEVRARMIRMALINDRTPLTSVRRALTNLTAAGSIVKTDKQKQGPYGRPEFLYALPKGQLRLV